MQSVVYMTLDINVHRCLSTRYFNLSLHDSSYTNQTLSFFSATMTNIVILVVLIGSGLVNECLGACDSQACIGGVCGGVANKSCNQDCVWGKCDLSCTSSVGECTQDCTWGDCNANSNAETFNQFCTWGGCKIACLENTKQCNQSCFRGGCNSTCDAEKCQQDCAQGGCELKCPSDAKECIQECSGGNCRMSCSSNVAKCEQNCFFGGCDLKCFAKECEVHCPGGGCTRSGSSSSSVRAGLGITNFLFWAFAIVGRFF